jgi:hypothetical protein
MPMPRLAPLALVALAAALTAGAAAQNVPDWPDLMLKTRITHQDPANSVSTTVIYLKGPRARREMESEGRPIPQFLDITQCDEHRTVILNPEAKAYAYRPIMPVRRDVHVALGAGMVLRGAAPSDTTGVTVTVTNDAVDTGERRQFNHYTARHVITTHKTEPHPGSHMSASATTVDGWYLDLPDASCTDPADQEVFTRTGIATMRPPTGGAPERVEFKQLGTALRGYPIEETVTHTEGPPRPVRLQERRELIELSEAPLDDALFTVPPDYLPALPMPNGGFDLRKQDTLFNRLALYYQNAVAWWDYLTTGRPSYGHGY